MAAFTPVAYLGTSVFLSAVAVKASREDSLGLVGLSVSLALLAFAESQISRHGPN